MNDDDTVENSRQLARDAWTALNGAERRAVHAVLRRSRIVNNLNDMEDQRRTPGQAVADEIARRMGSWPFIIIQSLILVAWIMLNTWGLFGHWDPYPYILLNLALSFQAAYAAPIIMMSQNRQASKDRLEAEHDYRVNLHSEMEIAALAATINQLADEQWKGLLDLQHRQLDILATIERHHRTTGASGA